MATLKLTKEYQRYPKYKDSGVEWVGEIPEGWEAQKLYTQFDFRNEKVSDEDFEALSVTYGGVVPQIENAAKSNAEGSTRKRVKKGDVSINGRSDRRGAAGLSEYNGSVSLVYHVLKPRKGEDTSRYYHYLIRSAIFGDEFYRWGRGIVDDLWTTRSNEMKRIIIPVPTKEEQQKIATYLDEKTALIDAIIEKKKKQIELLREKRAAIINRAVTKGLDPNAKLVNSGIEWIGKIPEGWEVKKLNAGFSYEKGRNAGLYTQEFVKDAKRVGDYPVYSGQTASEGVLGRINTYEYDYPEGVLFSTTVGAKAMTTRVLSEKFSLSQNCVLMVPRSNADVWYFHYFLSEAFRIMKAEIPSHMQPSLRVSDLNKFQALFPGIEEQKRISEFLRKYDEQFDRATNVVDRSITLLQEFKSALISRVVTGKVKV